MNGWLKRIGIAALFPALILSVTPVMAAAGKRVALVIGNGAYLQVPKLANPAADARAMAAALKSTGFTVIEGVDLALPAMLDRIHAFGQAAEGSEIALVFYAGHGLQVAGRNYLLPVDAKLQRETDLRREAVEVDEILGEARQARRLRLVILDACRDNPFLAQMARSLGTRSALVGRGFARIDDIESDTLIAYATKADAIAEDGEGTHSPYTSALLKHLTAPDLTVERFFGKVRDSVQETTKGRQQPFVYGSLGGEPIYLTRAPASPAVSVPESSKAADATELAFWDAIKTSANPADYQAYLDTYPAGRFAALAKVRARVRTTVASVEPASVPVPVARMIAPPVEPVPSPATTPQVSALAAGIDCGRFGAAGDRETCDKANAGDPSLITAVAARLERGQGTVPDETEAARLYRLAAERGDARARTGLGELLESGRGVPADEVAAAGFYKLAAEQGDAQARYDLGVMLENGRGGPRDEAAAARWYRLAADQGNADAQVTLGLLLEKGRGVARDLAAAAELYRRAAEHGHPQGQAYLAALLEQGRGVPRDPAEALRYYRLAAAQGSALAQTALQRLGQQ
ncbi:MAG: caspase family protein [Rhodospirillaceae bacterium]